MISSRAIDLKRKRKKLGLTQTGLAKKLDINVITVSRWERGASPIPWMAMLAVEQLLERHVQRHLRRVNVLLKKATS